jgi:hypothetical protein
MAKLFPFFVETPAQMLLNPLNQKLLHSLAFCLEERDKAACALRT